MNRHFLIPLLLATLASLTTPAPAQAESVPGQKVTSDYTGETAQFIFYSVLEGLYTDGVSNEDVDQILLRKENQSYYHFIYSCPICTPTIWALEAYRARPVIFYSSKVGNTFGPGLSAALHDQLHSPDADQRLIAINTLVHTWITRRMDAMKLTPAEREILEDALAQKRQKGMDALKGFRTNAQAATAPIYAPAYQNIDECAACNGAVGQPMPLPDAKGH